MGKKKLTKTIVKTAPQILLFDNIRVSNDVKMFFFWVNCHLKNNPLPQA